MKDKTFEELWRIAYLGYLKLRRDYNIPLTPEQLKLLEEVRNEPMYNP